MFGMCEVLWCTWKDDVECVWVNRFHGCVILIRKRKVVGLKKKEGREARAKSKMGDRNPKMTPSSWDARSLFLTYSCSQPNLCPVI